MKSAKLFFRGLVFLFLIETITLQESKSQTYYLPLNNDFTLRYESYFYKTDTAIHTAIRPFLNSEVHAVAPLDSLLENHLPDNKFNRTWFGRKLRKEHLVQVHHEDYTIHLDPAFEFRGTADAKDDNDITFINTRGVLLGGTVGKYFSFQSSFYESQSDFPKYLDTLFRKTRVVPGGARSKNLYGKFDYAIASGTITYSLKKYFNFQFGHDKVFIGDGYRSLLLSDNAFNYPFLKITSDFWKIKYVNLYTIFQDLNLRSDVDDGIFTKKYGSFHFLDVNIGKRFSFGVLEAIIWQSDSLTGRDFDLNYLNPIIFFRPVEFSMGSPDNALIGFNLKYKITNSISVYSQLMLDEFKIREVRSGNGWWSNKQAVQFGIKAFDVLKIRDLHFRTEINVVRPYTYQHKSSLTAYGHYNQPIAHPLGANFWESVSIVNYKYRNFFGEIKLIYSKIGYNMTDLSGNTINYGQDVFESYFTRSSEYGNEIAQGLTTKQLYNEMRIGYLVNPKTNFIIEAGVVNRIAKNIYGTNSTMLFYFGIRTALTNRYFDL